MAFITRSELSTFHKGFSLASEYITPLQAKSAAKHSWEAEATIFLSHSHKDRQLIEPVLAFLRSHGVKIYVDWLDEGMPDVVSGETAKKIKYLTIYPRIERYDTKWIVWTTEPAKLVYLDTWLRQ